jgi:putative lipoic acid-binding regulatory protein
VDGFLGGRKPQIDYPCTWAYRIIGLDELRMRSAVREIVGESEHSLTFGLESARGKYRSLQLELVVADEAERLRIFAALRSHPDVRFVF